MRCLAGRNQEERAVMRIKNTVPCPGCGGILRVCARIVNDGSEYEYYLCRNSVDIVRQDPSSGAWKLQGAQAPEIPEVVRTLQGLAVDEWRGRTAKRESVISTRLNSEIPDKVRP